MMMMMLILINGADWVPDEDDQDNQKCPNCPTIISRNEGCYKVMCPSCRYAWCWRCRTAGARCTCNGADHGFLDPKTG
eukprot:UN00138